MNLRLHAEVHGQVQGVGFRPWIARLARRNGFSGWVKNCGAGAVFELQGDERNLRRIVDHDLSRPPPPIQIESQKISWLPATAGHEFKILDSRQSAWDLNLPQDRAVCHTCREEAFDTQNRRYLYPFTHCAACGPRWSILRRLPYDRANTTLNNFNMCKSCRAEYDDPDDRRHHAQSITCWDCGPRLWFSGPSPDILAEKLDAVEFAAMELRAGKIVAVLGMAGFQLWVDAGNEEAVIRLRARKRRPRQPFALIGLEPWMVWDGEEQETILHAPEAPIVLVDKKAGLRIAPSVAPENPHVGVMRPSTVLQELLLRRLPGFAVATSGNLSGEPICRTPDEARARLAHIADFFLVHDLEIARTLDDSVVRILRAQKQTLRCARGLAPLHLAHPSPRFSFDSKDGSRFCLSAGGDLKSAIAVMGPRATLLSQHLGDLGTREARANYLNCARDFAGLTTDRNTDHPRTITEGAPTWTRVVDAHPHYHSRFYGAQVEVKEKASREIECQHHFAHALSVWAEHHHPLPALAFVWDGTGFGPPTKTESASLWGGECLEIRQSSSPPSAGESRFSFARVAHLHGFPLPGGEQAVREPRRALLGLLFELGSSLVLAESHFRAEEYDGIGAMLSSGINSPRTTSIGRLFDAISALLGSNSTVSFEGEAALALEHLSGTAGPSDKALHFGHYLSSAVAPGWDWREWLPALLEDLHSGTPRCTIGRRFHNTLIETAFRQAELSRIEGRGDTVTLSGGVFQNRILTEEISKGLEDRGFQVFYPRQVPINDGGLAAGQAMICV